MSDLYGIDRYNLLPQDYYNVLAAQSLLLKIFGNLDFDIDLYIGRGADVPNAWRTALPKSVSSVTVSLDEQNPIDVTHVFAVSSTHKSPLPAIFEMHKAVDCVIGHSAHARFNTTWQKPSKWFRQGGTRSIETTVIKLHEALHVIKSTTEDLPKWIRPTDQYTLRNMSFSTEKPPTL